MITNGDSFSQPSLIIFTKGTNIFAHDCISDKEILREAYETNFNT